MQEKKIVLNFTSAHLSELDTKDKELIANAKAAFTTAYAPYSGFMVGSGILLNNGEMITGSNQENVAFPSGLCAERVAIYSALSQGIEKFKAIAIVSNIGARPCGSCRQIMHEYLGDIPIYISDSSSEHYKLHYIKELLPYPFG